MSTATMMSSVAASPADLRSGSGPPARPGQNAWWLTVVDAFDVAPDRRRVRLVSELDGFAYASSQSLALRLPHLGAEAALRDFSVCAFDAEEECIELDFILRRESPATAWVRAASLGDHLIAESLQF
jgi:NADPH-dependent ferric siderophore reductase